MTKAKLANKRNVQLQKLRNEAILFLAPFERFGFSKFGADKPNTLTTIGIENATSKVRMQDKMRQHQRTIEA
ncbi:hypothetical protein [Aliivibrio fischeri]|uniref:hypothetical protein n=1 Tax=Aliivibrio fischeri TaxID=668 RepID=UPI00166B5808|nr:hypothetical protein [Aliivibrio fischeri]GGK50004.1 hypothetical protein GCM10007987_36330 [Aliivibrio fischeri]